MAAERALAVLVTLVIAGGVTAAAGQRSAQGRPTPATSPGAQSESPTGQAQFRSTLTFRPAPVEPQPPSGPRGPGLHGFPFLWGWAPVEPSRHALSSPSLPPADAPTGGVQLDVLPWRARVYVDGVYVGRVADFNGYYKHLTAVAGPHQIVIVESGYQPLILDVVVLPGRTTTYRGTLTGASLR